MSYQPTGLAKVGKDTWLWCVWPQWPESKDDTPYGEPDPVYGYELTKEAGLRKILEVTGATGFYERWRDRADGLTDRPYSNRALEWRHRLSERRRKPNHKAAPHAQATEHVYHHESSLSDFDNTIHHRTCAHRILKKTAKSIFIEAGCYEHEARGRSHRLDRVKLESVDPIFKTPGCYFNSGEFRGAMCGVFFTLDPVSDWEKEQDGDVPECLQALGLKLPATEQQVKRAFRRLAKKHHPDAGGESQAFRHLQEQYETALALVSD